MTTLQKALLGVALLLGLVIGLLIPLAFPQKDNVGGVTNLDSLTLSDTLSSPTTNASSATATNLTVVTGMSIASGASTTVSNCTSTTWNPASISSTTVATTSIAAIPGLALGQLLDLSLDTSTVSSTGVQASLYGGVTLAGASTGTLTVGLTLPGNVAGNWDITTSTLRACWRTQ